jgi:adenylate cyclase
MRALVSMRGPDFFSPASFPFTSVSLIYLPNLHPRRWIMAQDQFKRKLTAILNADAVGYSRLMGEDEAATVSTMKSHRNLIAEQISAFKGRVLDSPGDNILAEFGSIVDAVTCAVEVQNVLKEKNEKLPENRKMIFRIGVNLGDVIEDEDRIYGDGVNIAARIENLADPGGVAISGTAFDSVRNKLRYGYQFSGEQRVKNIASPVRVYKILTEPKYDRKVIGERQFFSRISRKVAVTAVLFFAIVTGGLVVYQIYLYQSGRIEPASLEKMVVPLADKPSIAVLAFDNMSNDPEQEYFSNGISENLITDLSKIHDFLVISRNTSFSYRGKPVKVDQIAKELNVRYILEGSVQKAGNNLRINAQLIDASTGHHIWADRYDGNISDIFSLQDKITQKIATSLAIKLTDDQQSHLAQHGTKSIEAYEAFLKGVDLAHYLRMDTGKIAESIPWFEKAIKLDPDYSNAYAALAEAYMRGSVLGVNQQLGISLRLTRLRAANYLRAAMENPTHIAYREMARFYIMRFQDEEALNNAEKAIAIDPNDADNNSVMAQALIYSGSPDAAIPFCERMRRIDPACMF